MAGCSIINTASVVTFEGNNNLIYYIATKGANIGVIRALMRNHVTKGVSVNAIYPGKIWLPLIPSNFSANQVPLTINPIERQGQSFKVAQNCHNIL
ncbi:SDR family NAD(P)-dependent oxidoreductase [Ornithinibacillus xuwenensis]|uniref:SDR family NAD(P)-dependent oxidoreductase n=1 Tax=Ornithinibacillus xuwenensis TaxID=3144668 RepID=A0ABU9XGT4_9BACI